MFPLIQLAFRREMKHWPTKRWRRLPRNRQVRAIALTIRQPKRPGLVGMGFNPFIPVSYTHLDVYKRQGEHGVNIANFALGRERAGAKPVKALALVQVDAPVSDKVLEALGTIEALLEARLVQLPEAGA